MASENRETERLYLVRNANAIAASPMEELSAKITGTMLAMGLPIGDTGFVNIAYIHGGNSRNETLQFAIGVYRELLRDFGKRLAGKEVMVHLTRDSRNQDQYVAVALSKL